MDGSCARAGQDVDAQIEPVENFAELGEHLLAVPLGCVSEEFRPRMFRLRRGDAAAARSALPQLDVLDTALDQLRELARIRHPKEKLEGQALEQAVAQLIAGRALAGYGVWVFYPWSRRLVHILDQQEFAELRTNRNCYKITPAEQAQLATKRIGVIGLSVGQAIATTMAAERGFGEIRLADFDRLDLTNLNRIRGGLHHLGVAKVIVAAREIAEIDPFLTVRCYGEGATEGNLDAFLTEHGKLDLLVEESDSLDIKFLAREHARRHGIPVLMDTSDRGMLDIERFDIEPRRPLLHGLAGDIDYRSLGGLSFEERVPHMLKMLDVDSSSRRLRASMLEIKHTVESWPQLASAVALGGGLAADTARRLLLGERIVSGRYYVDLDQIVSPSETASSPARKYQTDSGRTNYPERMLNERAQAWNAPAQALNLDSETVESLVEAGCAAPSGGNAQPWRWAYGSRKLLLLHDGARPGFLDFHGYASAMTLGAASENVLLRARQQGLHATWLSYPFGEDDPCCASFAFTNGTSTEEEIDRRFDHLAEQIFHRHTNRRLGARQALSADQLQSIRAAAQSIPSVRLHLLTDKEQLSRIADVLGTAQQLLLQHAETYHQMMSELRWGEDDWENDSDGIDVDTLDLSPIDRAGLELCRDWDVLQLNRSWGGGGGLQKLARKSIDSASAVALVSVPTHRRRDYFQGGRAAQRAWLAATRAGVAVQPISALTYLFNRWHAGGRDTLSAEMAHSLESLWPSYAEVFQTDSSEAGVLLFRLALVDLPRARSKRKPINQVLRFFHANHRPQSTVARL